MASETSLETPGISPPASPPPPMSKARSKRSASGAVAPNGGTETGVGSEAITATAATGDYESKLQNGRDIVEECVES